MPFLVIGPVTVEVVTDGASERAAVRIGARDRGASGRDGGRVRAEKRPFGFTSFDLTAAQWSALRAATPPKVPVFCEGDALPAPGDFLVERSAEVEYDLTTQAAVYVAALTLEQA